MADKKKNKRIALQWNKTMIAEILGCTPRELIRAVPDEWKERLKSQNRYYYDLEAFEIIKSVRKLATDAEIKALLYPKGL